MFYLVIALLALLIYMAWLYIKLIIGMKTGRKIEGVIELFRRLDAIDYDRTETIIEYEHEGNKVLLRSSYCENATPRIPGQKVQLHVCSWRNNKVIEWGEARAEIRICLFVIAALLFIVVYLLVN